VVRVLLDAGTDPAAQNKQGNIQFDLIDKDSPLRGAQVYQRLKEARPQ